MCEVNQQHISVCLPYMRECPLFCLVEFQHCSPLSHLSIWCVLLHMELYVLLYYATETLWR
jgi:hypothetical protein